MDVEGVRRALETSLERSFTVGMAMGGGRFSIVCESMVFVVERGQVITVLDDSTGARVRAAHPQEREAQK